MMKAITLNKKVIGKFKDEACGILITEFVVTSKMMKLVEEPLKALKRMSLRKTSTQRL